MSSRLSSLLLVSGLLLALMPALADEPRPKLRIAPRDYFAGRIVAIPAARHPEEASTARMTAEVADHDLITPTETTRRSGESLRAWLLRESGEETDGLILAWEALAESGDEAKVATLLRGIRAWRPRLPIYLLMAGESPTATELWREGVVDLMALPGDSAGLPAGGESGNRRKVALGSLRGGLTLLVARMINSRFGLEPRLLPVWSSAGAADLRAEAGRAITAAGGREVSPAVEGERSPESLLFVHLPGTTESERAVFIEGMARAIGRNARIAIVDLAADTRSSELLIGQILERRWLDRLSSLSAGVVTADPVSRGELRVMAIAHAVAQSSMLVCSMRFLRDDPNRVFRVERALAGLLLGSYLSGFTYPRLVAPRVAEWRREVSEHSEIERRSLAVLQAEAESIFERQFRRNTHTTLLRNGERMRFEVRLLQRLRLRLSAPADADAPLQPEIRPSIYLVHMGNLPPASQMEETVFWEVTNDDLDPRLISRWIETPWSRFAIGARAARVTFRNGDQSLTSEGYRIRSRLSGTTRQIEITTASVKGAFYAITGLERLAAGGQLARDLEITSIPAIAERGVVIDRRGAQAGWSLREQLDLIATLGRHRMNTCVIIDPTDEPGGEVTRRPDSSAEPLQRAAALAFVRLVRRSPAPPESEAIPLVDQAVNLPCLSPVPSASSEGAGGAGSVRLWRLPTHPYSAWPRLATAAESAWNPRDYQQETALSAILAAEDPRTAQGVRAWSLLTNNCATLRLSDLPERTATRLLIATELINGSREAGLMRGELIRALRGIPTVIPPPQTNRQ